MAVNELQAKITADVTGLEKSLSDAQKSFDSLGKSIANLEKDIADNIRISQGYEKAIDDLNRELREGTISQKDYAKSLDRLTRDERETIVETKRLRSELRRLKADQKALASTTPTLTNANKKLNKSNRSASAGAVEFGRLLGDLPFGIQGVANNIQQLAFVMGGGAALQIGIAAVTGLMLVFDDELKALSKDLFGTTGDVEDLAESLDKLNESFDSEIALSKAIEENLDLQGISTTEILKTRKELINAQLTELANLIKQQQELLNIQKLENERVDNLEFLLGITKALFNGIVSIGRISLALAGEALKPLEAQLKLTSELLGIELDRNDFASASTEEIEKQRKLQVKLNELLTQQKQLENDILEINQKQAESIRDKVTKIPVEFDVQGLADIETPEITGNLDGLFKVPTQETQQLAQNLLQLQSVASAVQTSMDSSFSAIASGITNNLSQSEDGLERFGAALLANTIKVLGAALSQSIANSILGATQGAVGTGPLAPFSQPAFIASMVGGVISAFAAIPKFAQGGIVPGGNFNGDKVPAMLNSGEMILNSRQQSNLFDVLNGTLSGLQSSRQTDDLQLDTVLRGSDILLSVSRAERNNNRFFGNKRR